MLQTILGVGTNIAKRIEGLSTARAPIPRWEALRRKLPAGLLSLQAIPGLRPVTTSRFTALLGVSSERLRARRG